MRPLRPFACAALLVCISSLSLPASGGRALPELGAGEAAAQAPISLVVAANPILAGDTVTLTALNAMTFGSIRWTISGPGVTTVDSSARTRRTFRFSTPGTVTVAVRDTFTSDTATVSVLGLQLLPRPLSLLVGAKGTITPQFTGGGRVPLAWTSDNPTVARVDTSGGVTGVTPGRAVVFTRHRGAFRDDTVFVTAPVAQGECERSRPPAWIWCDDFDRDRLGSYFGYDDANRRFVRREGAGRGGSAAMAATFRPGRADAGSLRLAFGRVPATTFLRRLATDSTGRPADSLVVGVDTSFPRHREIWWRFYVRYDSGWSGGGGNRLTAATVFASRARAQAMVGFVWSPNSLPRPGSLSIDPATGVDASGTVRTTRYEDFARLRFLGTAPGNSAVTEGAWHCVEAHARLNSPGKSDALFELFVDGRAQGRRADFDWVRGFRAFGINGVVFDNLWPEMPPREQTRFLDNFVVSTLRVGCGAP
jgi:hypothetical protein